MSMPESIRRQVVETKLTQFYRTHCPQKLHVVSQAYEQFKDKLGVLFSELLKRYPRAPSNTFDDLQALLAAEPVAPRAQEPTGHAGADRGGTSSEDMPPLPADLPVRELVRLLGEGERLLALSPNCHRTPNAPAAAPSAAHADEGLARDEQRLREVIEENRALVQEVAVAELQVLDRRFELLLRRCLREDGMLECISPRAAEEQSRQPEPQLLTMQVIDGSRTFQIPMNEALWRFMCAGPLQAPLPPAQERPRLVCTVNASHTRKPVLAAKVIVAMAMRHWSRHVPHTITEAAHEGAPLRFHASSQLWWEWPSRAVAVRGVKAESMFAATALAHIPTGDIANNASRWGNGTGSRPPLDAGVLELFQEDARAIDGGAQCDYWAFFLDQWDLLGSRGSGGQFARAT